MLDPRTGRASQFRAAVCGDTCRGMAPRASACKLPKQDESGDARASSGRACAAPTRSGRRNAAYRGCVASHQHCSYVGFNVCAARGGGVPALCPHHQIPLETTPPVYNASNLRQCWCIKNTYTVRGAGPGGVSRARPSALTPILPERPPWHGVRRDQRTTVSVRFSTYTRWVAMARCGWESLPSTGSTVSRRVGGS